MEVLVSIGVVALLLSFLGPYLGAAKGSGLRAKTVSNLRQMAIGLQLYADSNKDLPPVYGPPSWPAASPWHFEFGDVGQGDWFEHSYLYSYAVLATLGDCRVARSAGNPDLEKLVTFNGVPVSQTDFLLTNTLYAAPAFFNWQTQTGPKQFAPQAISSIATPSSKGVLWAFQTFGNPKYGRVLSCCSVDLPAPIAFADQSVSEHVMRRMPAGIINLYAGDGVAAGVDPRTLGGTPVANTVNGVLGRDR